MLITGHRPKGRFFFFLYTARLTFELDMVGEEEGSLQGNKTRMRASLLDGPELGSKLGDEEGTRLGFELGMIDGRKRL